MSKHTAYFDRDTITWSELYKILKVWLEYGDDVFEDEYSAILEELKNTADTKRKEHLKMVLDCMDLVREMVYT